LPRPAWIGSVSALWLIVPSILILDWIGD